MTTTLANLSGSDQYFEVVQDQDGGANQPVPAGNTLSFTSTYASYGSHQILIVKNTELTYGDSQFLGFTFNGGQLQAPLAPASALRLETYGDSISAGYGDLGTSSSCVESPPVDSAFVAYSSVATRLLGAEPPTLIAVSGSTINSSGFSLLSYFNQVTSSTTWTYPTAATEQPNVVVINQGTNDANQGFSDASITNALVSFGQTLRGQYPSAALVFVASPMIETFSSQEPQDVQAAVQALTSAGDQNVYYLDFFANDPNFPSDDTLDGCNGHPDEADQALMGSRLATFLRGLGY